jgi:predicted O-linked N-acetylglucosamine transferase (SPINDLY family)
MLYAIGLPELVTTSPDEYESMALALAANPDRLGRIRQTLQQNRLTAPLFDTGLFTKRLEAAYIMMVERYQANLMPDHIYVTA